MATATVARKPSFQAEANRYAKVSIESLRDMLDALEHSQECDGMTDCPKCEGTGYTVDASGDHKDCKKCKADGRVECKRGQETRTVKLADGRKVKQHLHDAPETWHDSDAAEQRIQQDPLSVQVRSDWYTPGETAAPGEFNILLGTGGPAARIVGNLNEFGQPDSASFEFQDWFKPWTKAHTTREQDETMLEYATRFYFES